jgi:hypothetical protein
MSIQKVNHPVWKPFDAQKILATVQATESGWWDTNGWTDKVVTVEVTSETPAGSAQIDINVDLWVSPKGYYELENETTVDTDDYEVISIVDGLTAATLTRYDAQDVDDLQRPIRSMKVVVDNDHASLYATVDVWVEGWS